MRYQGGKGKLAPVLAPVILKIAGGRRIVEPFHGGLAMTAALRPAYASDLSAPMHCLITHARAGWVPPSFISEEQYQALSLRKDEVDNPEVCWAGQGCTFGGKWFGGYARGHKSQREPIRAARETFLRRIQATLGTNFSLGSYERSSVQLGDVVYCDPPYKGTSQDYPTPSFDHDAFWAWARWARDSGANVLVSEFSAPEDVQVIWEKERPTLTRHLERSTVVERLYYLEAA